MPARRASTWSRPGKPAWRSSILPGIVRAFVFNPHDAIFVTLCSQKGSNQHRPSLVFLLPFCGAESKLIDSREKIANIENPTWYVLDRYSNTGYNSFIQDTESIENISKVFPIVFFMVALLISLTSMTRMVEEQRTQIGTLKALGYNKLQIASKYVIYAGLACVIGGVLGMSVGFVLLPQIIWTMYQMMYQMTDNIHISFNIIIGGMGLLSFWLAWMAMQARAE